MTDETKNTEITDAYAMSDSEFIESFGEFLNDSPEVSSEDVPEQEEQSETQETNDEEGFDDFIEDPEPETTIDETDEDTDEEELETDEADSSEEDTPEEEESDEESEEDSDVVDYEAEYKKLLKPFKANGKEISVDNVDEAVRLMQMGANYSKNLGELKPFKRVVKMLENNDLLDEDKLSFLIDLSKQDPNAIAKLLKDSNINPIEMDLDNSEYKQGNHKVSDSQIALDEVMDSVRNTPTGNQTLTIIGSQWDEASRNTIVRNPSAIEHINKHMELGIYDVISTKVAKEKALGNLNGLSDLDAYKLVGDKLYAQGAFNDLVPKATGTQQPKAKPKPAPKPKQDPKVALKKKRAAAIPKGNSGAKQTSNMTRDKVWSMSDEEFEKQFAKFS